MCTFSWPRRAPARATASWTTLARAASPWPWTGRTGLITADGVDQDFRRIARHPLTGTALKGFQIPNWDKAIDVVERAARLAYTLPQCRWIGWDLAFLADGDVAIIEGNWRPGTLAQNTHPRGIYHELLKLTDKL